MDKKAKLEFSIDEEAWEKFRYIAQRKSYPPLLYLYRTIHRYIKRYEKKYGEIDINEDDAQ